MVLIGSRSERGDLRGLRVRLTAVSPDLISRQVVNSALRSNLPFFSIACLIVLVGAVSYTHLDVYKRQARRRDREDVREVS